MANIAMAIMSLSSGTMLARQPRAKATVQPAHRVATTTAAVHTGQALDCCSFGGAPTTAGGSGGSAEGRTAAGGGGMSASASAISTTGAWISRSASVTGASGADSV